MADRLNSGKKIEYAKGVGEALAKAKADIQNSVAALGAICDKVKFAAADRYYNEVVVIGEALLEACNEYASGVANEVLIPLVTGKGGNLSGPALKTQVNAVVPELEAIAAGSIELPRIAQSTIDSRGLEENWTDSTRAEFSTECQSFIAIRAKLMARISETTQKCADEDTKTVYANLGRKFETISNKAVGTYNELKNQLAEAGILLKETADIMENAYQSIKTEGPGHAGDILGEEDLV